MDPAWFGNVEELIDACYARTAQAFMDSLLQAETAPGTALDQVAAFLVAILEVRRQRGTLLSFRRGRDLPAPLQRRLHERDMMVRMRLKRILSRGRRDGSLALRDCDSACELILASLQVADIAAEEPEQRMWDSELVEFLLAALSPMHETRTFCSRCGYVTSVGELRAGPETGEAGTGPAETDEGEVGPAETDGAERGQADRGQREMGEALQRHEHERA
jgi:AcrR family transcriptional regulator